MLSFLSRLFLAADNQAVPIADSLRDEPERWCWEDYYVVHDSGTAIWHANGTFGIQVLFDFKSHHHHGRRWTPSWAERHLINKALDAYRKRDTHKMRRVLQDKMRVRDVR